MRSTWPGPHPQAFHVFDRMTNPSRAVGCLGRSMLLWHPRLCPRPAPKEQVSLAAPSRLSTRPTSSHPSRYRVAPTSFSSQGADDLPLLSLRWSQQSATPLIRVYRICQAPFLSLGRAWNKKACCATNPYRTDGIWSDSSSRVSSSIAAMRGRSAIRWVM